MTDSHTPLTHPTPFRFRPREPVTKPSNRVRTRVTRTRAAAIAKDLQRLVHDLLQPLTLEEEILAVLDYGNRATTAQIALLIKRRKTTVIAAVHALAHAGKIERCDRRWVRVEEHHQ